MMDWSDNFDSFGSAFFFFATSGELEGEGQWGKGDLKFERINISLA